MPAITREGSDDEAPDAEEYDVEYKTYKTTREHALDRPDMYGGSKYPLTATLRVLDDEGLHSAAVTYTPISRRCFTEVLDNLQDAGTVARERGLPIGRQEVTLSARRISVYNESGYIPIKKQPAVDDGVEGGTSEVWKPFACFGTLMTSSNYDDDTKRNVAGRNGIGAKIAPIFSSWFELDVRDPSRKLRYTQVWRENASVVDEPIVEPWTDFSVVDGKRCGSVRVSWVVSPASGVSSYSPEVLGLFRKAVADASYTSDVPISLVEYADGDEDGWTGEASETSYDLRGERYLSLYPKLSGARSLVLDHEGSRVRLFDTPGAATTESFVNNGCTPKGGVHAHAWRQWLYRALHAITVVRFADKLAPKKGAPKAKEMTDKGLEKLYGPHVSLILACTLDKPTYDGQAKEECTGPVPSLPSTSDAATDDEALAEQLRTLESWRVFEEVEAALDAKVRRKANKDNGRKTEFVDVPGAEDAEWAGTKMSGECALILCEGEGGKTTAIKGLHKINPKAFGVYTLEGKIANFRQHPAKSAEVVRDLKKLLGWAPGKLRKDLRYGRVQIMTDADPDGVHIRLLAISMIHIMFPGLIEDGFVEAFIFPIVTLERRGEKLAFYTMQEYEHWAAEHENGRGYTPKYFKGLGSCNDADVTYAFTHPLVVRYLFDELAEEALRLAFDKGQEDERKDWLVRYDPKERFVYPNVLEISTSVVKELPIFAIYDTERCIPSLMDGLNVGQRKVVHIVRKNNITSSIKTKQLSGLVANGAAYHHNEDVLEHTIIRMNWTFPGSNNVPLLQRSGEFGSRRKKGKDAAPGRYTFTSMSPILKVAFTEEDDLLLEWNLDGVQPIEPRYFYSVIAIVLANCQKGIGVGSNCDVPCYDPEELIRRHRRHCEVARSQRLGQALVRQAVLGPLLPWARHYTGTITLEGGKVVDRGVFAQRGGTIHVTEVPLKMSFEDYEEKLNKMKATPLKESRAKKERPRKATPTIMPTTTADEEGVEPAPGEEAEKPGKKPSAERKKTAGAGRGGARVLKSHKHEAYDLHENGDDHCHFELREFALMPTHKTLKLVCTIPTSMMTVFDERGKLRHFDGPEQLLDHYSRVMIESRELLRVKLVQRCRERVQELELKARFVAEVVKQPTLVAGRKDAELHAWMTARGYPRTFLDMRLASITERMQAKLNEQLVNEQALLRHYDEMRGEELWLEQLARFEQVYERLYA
jgi:DNA topoisomerase II